MYDGWTATKAAGFAGLTFALLEAASAIVFPVPLDPGPTVFSVGLSVAGTGLILGLTSFLIGRVTARYAAGLTMALWAAVWGPHQAEIAGWHRVGWAPAVAIGGLAFVAPPLAVGVGALGGVSGAIFRRRGGKVGLTPLSREPSARGTSPDILLVTVDTMRADAGLLNLGQWRADSDFSPIQGWTHFTEAYSAAPWTLPSMHSLMSGRPVRLHGGGLPTPSGLSRRLSDAIPFPYVLQQAGYETTALISSPFLSEEQGFADGFDRWSHCADAVEPVLLLNVWTRLMSRLFDTPREIDLSRNKRLAAEAIETIATPSQRPRFIWVHLVPERSYVDGKMLDEDAYADSVQEIRLLVRKVVASAGNWVVAIAGAHGESLGEGGRWGSGQSLTDAELHVPLAIRRPNTQGGMVTRPVATSDLARSLLAVVGSGRHFSGQNLMTVRRKPIDVGGLTEDPGVFGARTTAGKYIKREPGHIGPGVQASDRTEENLRRSGYLD